MSHIVKKGEIVPLKSKISDDKNFRLGYDAPIVKYNVRSPFLIL